LTRRLQVKGVVCLQILTDVNIIAWLPGCLRDRWSVLEEVYAVALDRGMTSLSEEDERLASGAVEQLLQMLTAQGHSEGDLGQ
jgi:hypothetical protein